MHPQDDQLRAYSDQELSTGLSQQIGEHLKRCLECRARLERMQRLEQQVRTSIDSLAPTPLERPRPAREAYARFAFNHRPFNSQITREKTMMRRKTLLSALAILTALVLIFTITPARAWAGTFLNLFRVQKVQVITFDPAAAENIHNLLGSKQTMFEQVFKDDLEVTPRGEAQPVNSVEEAAQLAGFTPRIPSAIENANLSVEPGMQGILTIDQPKLQELVDLAGVDLVLPESLDGQVVKVDVPAAVVVSSGCDAAVSETDLPDADCLMMVQMPSPTVNAPDDFDLPRMGEALFTMLGYAPDEARQLSQNIDWTSTLVLPIPTDPDVEYYEVRVDGVSGTLLREGRQAMLVWIKDGMLYAVKSPSGDDLATMVAQSLK